MNEEFQKDLLQFLYAKYPNHATPFELADFFAEKNVDADTVSKTVEYLREKGYIIKLWNFSLKITAQGIDYFLIRKSLAIR